MDLNNLCAVPLLKILRYLDERSLLELSTSCSSLCKFIRLHRLHLTKRRIDYVMLHSGCNDEESWDISKQYTVSLPPTMPPLKHSTKTIHVRTPFESQLDNMKRLAQMFPTLEEWFAKKFANTGMGLLYFDNMFAFDSSECITEWNNMCKRNKITVWALVLKDTLIHFSLTNDWIKFCQTVQTGYLQFTYHLLDSQRHLLWTEEFANFIPTLSSLHLENLIYEKTSVLSKVPPSIHKFPPKFHCWKGMEMTIENLKKGMNLWYDGEQIITEWVFMLSDAWNPAKFAGAIGLPYEYADDVHSNKDIIFTNRNQRKLVFKLTACAEDILKYLPYYICEIKSKE